MSTIWPAVNFLTLALHPFESPDNFLNRGAKYGSDKGFYNGQRPTKMYIGVWHFQKVTMSLGKTADSMNLNTSPECRKFSPECCSTAVSMAIINAAVLRGYYSVCCYAVS